jgi:septum formation protein
MTPALHLASASPRRAELLRAFGIEFSVGGADIDETPLPGEAPDDMVLRLSREKAVAVERDAVILAADTAVVLDGAQFGKPGNYDEARSMLEALSGRQHEVVTGVAVRAGDAIATALSITEVRFRAIDGDEIRRYWDTGEPRDKAGGYGIQGLGGLFVQSISGSYSGVVGLPVYETAILLKRAGIDLL